MSGCYHWALVIYLDICAATMSLIHLEPLILNGFRFSAAFPSSLSFQKHSLEFVFIRSCPPYVTEQVTPGQCRTDGHQN